MSSDRGLNWVDCWLCDKMALKPVETDRGAACEMCADAAGYRECDRCHEHVEEKDLGADGACVRCAESYFERQSVEHG